MGPMRIVVVSTEHCVASAECVVQDAAAAALLGEAQHGEDVVVAVGVVVSVVADFAD